MYTDKDSETIPIEEKIVHPLYNIDPKTFSNDVMIVKLTQKSKKPTLKLRQAPIIEEQQRLTAIGYGVITLSNEVDIPETLQEVELGYISNEVCALMHAKEDITDDMMCTLESGKDAW